MMTCFSEPSLDDMLADPLIATVMAADGVERSDLETLMESVARAAEPQPRFKGRRAQRGGCSC
jgi:hypothetical protein